MGETVWIHCSLFNTPVTCWIVPVTEGDAPLTAGVGVFLKWRSELRSSGLEDEVVMDKEEEGFFAASIMSQD